MPSATHPASESAFAEGLGTEGVTRILGLIAMEANSLAFLFGTTDVPQHLGCALAAVQKIGALADLPLQRLSRVGGSPADWLLE